jgi:hypothetical protein
LFGCSSSLAKSTGWNLADDVPKEAPRHALLVVPPKDWKKKPFAPQEKCIANTRNSLQSNVMQLFWSVKYFCDFCLTSFQGSAMFIARNKFWPT